MSAPPSPLVNQDSRRTKQSKTRDLLLTNEFRSFNSRGFHDGYDDGKRSSSQQNFDLGYKKAYEKNFILSTLRGVAEALKTSNKHLSLLESMEFDDVNNIDKIKDNLVKICRQNRLEILAHYVSQIG